MNNQSKTVEHLTVKTGEKMKEKSQIITEKNGARNRKTGQNKQCDKNGSRGRKIKREADWTQGKYRFKDREKKKIAQ